MCFKSLSQNNNRQFKVGGLIFPSEKRERDLDKEISDISLNLYGEKVTFEEVQEFFDFIPPIDAIETYSDAREEMDSLFQNSINLCLEGNERYQL